MIGPFEKFAQLGVVERMAMPGVQLPDAKTLEREVKLGAASFGLAVQDQQLIGHKLVFPRGKSRERVEVSRTHIYSLCDPDELLLAVRAHMALIGRHGPGRVWFLDTPVHVVRDDGLVIGAIVDINNETPLLLVRSLYGHEAQAIPISHQPGGG